MDSTFYERFSALCKESGESPNAVARIIGASSGSVTAWKRGAEPRNATLAKIADYFGVTTDYLLGKEKKSASAHTGADAIRDDAIKFALFGGSDEITDEMYDEVKRFAAYIKQREAQKE